MNGSPSTRRVFRPATILLVVTLSFLLMVSQAICFVLPASPSADPLHVRIPYAYGITEDINSQPDELQQKIEQTAADYNTATENLANIEAQIADTQAKIDDLQLKLPDQKQRAAVAVDEYYRMLSSSNFYLEMIFSSLSFSDFLAKCEYVNRLQSSYMAEFSKTNQMVDDLNNARASLESDRQNALNEKTHAEEALADAQAARIAAQQAAAQAVADQQAAAGNNAGGPSGDSQGGDGGASATDTNGSAPTSNGDTSGTTNGSGADNGAGDAGGSGAGSDGIDWSTDKAAFVNQWAPRIDAYLAGSPLGGYGRTFAEAAWDYGVDPRFSPAISYTESSKGVYCFLPYNAWGWGYVSWPDWDTAIRAHVAGLARGYGYTISIDGAQRYCPDNWENWYNTTLAQMGCI